MSRIYKIIVNGRIITREVDSLVARQTAESWRQQGYSKVRVVKERVR